MDLDTIMIKNISKLGANYAGIESEFVIANGILNLDPKTEIGLKIAEETLQ